MIQKRYEAFIKTPFLWKDASVFNLNTFEIISEKTEINITIDEKLRLGKYVERLVSFELKQKENIIILSENLQIQQDKRTFGEIDCLLLKDKKPVHLEIIYKFYLYDPSVGVNEIDHFIGPNRKDSLKEKLTKLKNKQLPLLYSGACKDYLTNLQLNPDNISQQVYFKAQLFVPFSNQAIKLKNLNTDCIVGFYMNQNELDNFKDCKFFIPTKKDWLIHPYSNVDWLNFKTFKDITKDYFEQKFSSLFWLKHYTGVTEKVFLVWW
jgi:hypothetical protein